METEKVPKDKYRLARTTCFLLGNAGVFGYSSLYAAADYFDKEYSNHPDLMFWVVTVMNTGNFIGILLLIPFSRYFSILSRVLIILTISGFALLSIPLWNSRSLFSEQFAVYMILAVSANAGFTTGTMCTTNIAFAQWLGGDYIQTIIVGIATSHLSGVAIRFGTKLLLPIKEGAWVFFITSGVVNFLAVFLFLIANSGKFVKYHLKPYHEARNFLLSRKHSHINVIYVHDMDDREQYDDSTLYTPSVDDQNSMFFGDNGYDYSDMNSDVHSDMHKSIISSQNLLIGHEHEYIETPKIIIDLDDEDSFDLSARNLRAHDKRMGTPPPPSKRKRKRKKDKKKKKKKSGKNRRETKIVKKKPKRKVKYWKIIKKLKYVLASIFLINCVTTVIYPAFAQDIKSQFNFLRDADWWALWVVFLYSISDWSGRQFFATYFPFTNILSLDTLWMFALLRLAFLPLTLMFYEQWVVNDFGLDFVMCVMAMTHGYLTVLTFMKYSVLLKDHEQETGSALIQFALVGGLSIGSFISLGLIPILDPSPS